MSQPSAEEMAAANMARSLNDETLASRVDLVKDRPRSFTRLDKVAILDEAARRLRWGRKSEIKKNGPDRPGTWVKNNVTGEWRGPYSLSSDTDSKGMTTCNIHRHSTRA